MRYVKKNKIKKTWYTYVLVYLNDHFSEPVRSDHYKIRIFITDSFIFEILVEKFPKKRGFPTRDVILKLKKYFPLKDRWFRMLYGTYRRLVRGKRCQNQYHPIPPIKNLLLLLVISHAPPRIINNTKLFLVEDGEVFQQQFMGFPCPRSDSVVVVT